MEVNLKIKLWGPLMPGSPGVWLPELSTGASRSVSHRGEFSVWHWSPTPCSCPPVSLRWGKLWLPESHLSPILGAKVWERILPSLMDPRSTVDFPVCSEFCEDTAATSQLLTRGTRNRKCPVAMILQTPFFPQTKFSGDRGCLGKRSPWTCNSFLRHYSRVSHQSVKSQMEKRHQMRCFLSTLFLKCQF